MCCRLRPLISCFLLSLQSKLSLCELRITPMQLQTYEACFDAMQVDLWETWYRKMQLKLSAPHSWAPYRAAAQAVTGIK